MNHPLETPETPQLLSAPSVVQLLAEFRKVWLFGIDFQGFQDENHISLEQFQNFGMKIMGESNNNQPMNAANGLAIPNFAIFIGGIDNIDPQNMGWLIVVLLTLPDAMFLHLQSKGLGWEEPNVWLYLW